jgi:putative membrane protein
VNGLAQLAALIGALLVIVVAPVEMFLFDRPAARRFLHVETDNLADVRMWAFVVGFRNLLAGVGTLTGLLILRTGDEAVGRAVVLTTCAYLLLASLAMGIADLLGHWRPRGGSALGTVGASLPPLIALIAATGLGPAPSHPDPHQSSMRRDPPCRTRTSRTRTPRPFAGPAPSAPSAAPSPRSAASRSPGVVQPSSDVPREMWSYPWTSQALVPLSVMFAACTPSSWSG